MNTLDQQPDILGNKLKLINGNEVPDSFVTSLNEAYEWIWLPFSDANQLIPFVMQSTCFRTCETLQQLL